MPYPHSPLHIDIPVALSDVDTVFDVKGAPPAPSHDDSDSLWRVRLSHGRASSSARASQVGCVSGQTSAESSANTATNGVLRRLSEWCAARATSRITALRSALSWKNDANSRREQICEPAHEPRPLADGLPVGSSLGSKP